MRTRLVLAAGVVVLAAVGCHSDPASDPHEAVARTVGQQLTVAQVSSLIGDAKLKVEPTPENGMVVANLWASYEKLAFAAAHGDTLTSEIPAALAPTLDNARVTQWLDVLRRTMHSDTATQAAYDSAAYGLYSARHILFAYPPNATGSQKDSVRRLALTTRRTITAANFIAMAQKYSGDKASAPKGGYLGVFPKQAMNAAVATVVIALRPDSVSTLVPTQFGFDVIQRANWADAKADYVVAFSRAVTQTHDSLLGEKVSAAVGVQVPKSTPAAARDAASNPVKGSRDTTTLATYDRGGKFTAANMLEWVNLMQPNQRVQVLKDLPLESDAVITTFVHNLAVRGVLLRSADSAGLAVPDSLKTSFRALFVKDVVRSWKELGVAPDQLADSAKTQAEREQLAARRVDRFFQRGMAGEERLSQVSVPVETALDAKYETTWSAPAMASAVETARQMRSAADSVRAADSARGRGAQPPVVPKPQPAVPKPPKKGR